MLNWSGINIIIINTVSSAYRYNWFEISRCEKVYECGSECKVTRQVGHEVCSNLD